jgi:hypothetical protein
MSSHYHLVSATVISRGNLHRLLGVCLVVILGATLGPPVQAQIPPRRTQGQPKVQPPQPVDADGSVVSVQGSAIQMTTATNQTIMAVITPMTSVRVTGPATVDALQAKGGGSHSKLCVEFVADLAEGGKAKAAISRLAIITAGPGRPQGLLPESAAFQPPPAPAAGHGKAGAGANAGGDGGAFPGPVGGKTGHGKSHGKDSDGLDLGVGASSGPVKPPCVCTVRGTVKSCHGNSLIVAAGRTTVTAEVADNAQIEVDLSDVSIASRGDKIQVRGQTAGRPELVRAESVQITLAQPFSGGRKHGAGKTAKPEKSASKSGPAKKAAAPEPAEKNEEPAEAKTVGGGDVPKSKTKSKPKIGPDDEY